MPDSFSESSSTGWGSNLLESIKGVLFGLVLLVLSFPLLFWNEGRAVRTSKGLTEGLGAVATVPTDSVDPGKEGKLIHVSGAVKTDAPVADDQLGRQVTAAKLIRHAETVQGEGQRESGTPKKGGSPTRTRETPDANPHSSARRLRT